MSEMLRVHECIFHATIGLIPSSRVTDRSCYRFSSSCSHCVIYTP